MFRKGQIRKRWVAGILAAALVASGIGIMQADAATGIELPEGGASITVSISDSNEMAELASDVKVYLYQVATVDASGKYTAIGSFEGLQDEINKKKEKAEDWKTVTEKAREIAGNLDDETGEWKKNNNVTVSGTLNLSENGKNVYTIENEEGLGLYLIAAERVYDSEYTMAYDLMPSLVAVPGNNYNGTDESDDGWIYEMNVSLSTKWESEPLTGSLTITKNLEGYNADIGGATFVFEVIAKDTEGQVVYTGKVSTQFTGTETSKKIIIDNIPAGAVVEVEEIYQGSSYELSSGSVNSQNTKIVAKEQVENGGAESAARVSFENKYNGGTTGGSSVTNHFSYLGNNGWEWKPVSDNTTTENGKSKVEMDETEEKKNEVEPSTNEDVTDGNAKASYQADKIMEAE